MKKYLKKRLFCNVVDKKGFYLDKIKTEIRASKNWNLGQVETSEVKEQILGNIRTLV